MKLSPEALEAAATESWNALTHKDPLRDLKLTQSKAPEIYQAHLDMVKALLDTGCDPYKAVPVATNNRYKFDDYFDTGKKWCKELADYLKKWAVAKGLT